ncbi:MAG: hypothetical protein R2697_17710 [Ilumatobacteraceae bacterium]
MAGLLAVAMVGSGVAGGLIANSLNDDDPRPRNARRALLEIADGRATCRRSTSRQSPPTSHRPS